MAVKLIEKPDGIGVKRNESGVIGATRTFLITGLTSETHLQAMQDAYGVQGLPMRGFVHPVHTNVYAFNHDIEKLEKIADGTWKVQIAVEYSRADTAAKQQATTDPETATVFKVRKSGSLEWKDTQKDYQGTDLYTEWKSSLTATAQRQGATIRKPVAVRAMNITFNTTSDPTNQIEAMLGHGNAGVFYGIAVGSALCVNYNVESDDMGATFDVSVDFAIKESWAEEFIYTDPATGKLPSNYAESYNNGLCVKYAHAITAVPFDFLT